MNFKRFFKSEFVVNVTTLMTGTTIAQAIPIAISPILTRIYTPGDFGVLSLFLAVTAITGAISNGRYEHAIVLPKEDNGALNVVSLGHRITISLSLVLLLLVALFRDHFALWLGSPEISIWLFFIPISTFLIGIYNAFNYYNIRKKKFKNISKSLIMRSSSLGVSQVLIGLVAVGPIGLILGQIISYLTGNSILYKTVAKDRSESEDATNTDIKYYAKEYRKFPYFSLPSIFINSVTLNVVPIIISTIFSISTLGLYSLTQRIVGIPARVMGGSVSQVYYQKASQDFVNKGNAFPIFKKTLFRLITVSIPVFTILYFVAEPLFAFVFGEEWRIAGTYAKIIAPLAATRFVSSSLSPTVNVVQKQYISLFINITLLIATILIFSLGKYYNIDFVSLLSYYTGVLSFIYLMCIAIYWKIIK